MYALILLDISPDKISSFVLKKFLETLEDIDKQATEVSKIFESAWLIDLNTRLSFFRSILDVAQENRISYKVSFSEQEPKFTK